MSAIVAIQHECAHAFAAAKLGYKLNKIVLMPFGAIIDGDMSGISFKDELLVAACGPLCNLCTAIFFIALWWLKPTMYAFIVKNKCKRGHCKKSCLSKSSRISMNIEDI